MSSLDGFFLFFQCCWLFWRAEEKLYRQLSLKEGWSGSSLRFSASGLAFGARRHALKRLSGNR